jgi:hypothetical protein
LSFIVASIKLENRKSDGAKHSASLIALLGMEDALSHRSAELAKIAEHLTEN